MHGRLSFIILALLLLGGCSSKMLLTPDCHSCTVEEQEWKDFSWNELTGRWKGFVETTKNQQGAKKSRVEKAAELTFLTGEQFMNTHGGSCKGLAKEAVVLNGLFWEDGKNSREFDAFVPTEEDKVAYGRISFEKLNGKDLCRFQSFGRVMGKNRLDLPSVSFSDQVVQPGRTIASRTSADDINVEFLRFAAKDKPTKAFSKDGRKPSSVKEQERPPLMFRVFRVTSKVNKNRGEWSSTEELIYRLWKTE